MSLPFNSNYKAWRHQFDTEPVYTRKQMSEAIENCVKQHTVNRVIQELPHHSVAMQIVVIHKTDDGITVIVR